MGKKKKYLVSLATPDARLKGIEVPGRGIRKFSKSGNSFTVSDSGEAKDIKKVLGNSVAVSEIPNYKPAEDVGHTYSFGPKTRGLKCKEEDCVRLAWMGEYCPDHRPKDTEQT